MKPSIVNVLSDPDPARLKVLVVTSLFPRPRAPLNGVFNYHSVAGLSRLADVGIISPVPWIERLRDGIRKERSPSEGGKRPGRLMEFSPSYPTFLTVPVVGRRLNGYLESRALKRSIRRDFAGESFDVILCYWVYPDGYAVHRLAAEIDLPYIVVALGSDLNLMPQSRALRKRITATLEGAARVVTVGDSLRRKALELGAEESKCRVVLNGVNRSVFARRSMVECRGELGLPPGRRILLYIGTMDPVKGLDVLLDALSLLGEEERPLALLAGTGSHTGLFAARAAKLGLSGETSFLGSIPHELVPMYMNAADALCLPSRNEGCPNVVLEALACGTPVIASKVGGVPELVEHGRNGLLVEPDDPAAMATAIEAFFERTWDRDYIAETNMRSWTDVARETYRIIEEVAEGER